MNVRANIRKPHRDEYRWSLDLRVRWADVDSRGHVNNAHYFTYAESARIAYFEALLPGVERAPASGAGMILASTSCEFLRQLRYPASLEIGTRVGHLGRTSVTTDQAIFHAGVPAAHPRSVMVWFDYGSQRPAPLPDNLRAAIVEREGRRVASRGDDGDVR